ncbi:hypothetical protein GMORB2_1957 [Geosmithia morbida]|uniref:F-box domain-containing protein n=1 Tax=Geosmithia morbida TaxID=1094350 RepID=A0A9P5D4J4_9HYPO|nr:uncharacterized protein GMORB2_1957 [Geosmithia morbida]KAF4121549.1 hypothetical protein GMORB2_1957 [Geosmithia morbida]
MAPLTIADIIVDTCSYHRRDFDMALIRSPPHETSPVQPSLYTAFDNPPASDMGLLGRLPLELFWVVLGQVDVQSHFRLRHVNRQARAAVTAMSEYRCVAQHGHEGLRGAFRTGVASVLGMTDLYAALVRERCHLCGLFGGFLYIPSAARCCFVCIERHPDLRVMATSSFARAVALTTGQLVRELGPCGGLRTVPGTYDLAALPSRRPRALLPVNPAIRCLVSRRLMDRSEIAPLLKRTEIANQRFMVSTAFPWYDPVTGRPESGVSCKACVGRIQAREDDRYHHRRVFTRAGFLEHFERCRDAQCLWNQTCRLR